MPLDSKNIWHPSQDYIDNAQITKLADRLGVADFEEFYDFSLESQEAYWREVVDFCGVRWSRDYETYRDISRGAPFPSWFVGGELNWVDMILDNVEAQDRTAIVEENENGASRNLTYSELAEHVRRFAAGLKVAGLKRGDRVGLMMENGIDASISLLAVTYIGAITVPLFSGFGSDAIISRLSSCGAKVLITTTGFQRRGRFVPTDSTIVTVLQDLPDLEMLILKQSLDDP